MVREQPVLLPQPGPENALQLRAIRPGPDSSEAKQKHHPNQVHQHALLSPARGLHDQDGQFGKK